MFLKKTTHKNKKILSVFALYWTHDQGSNILMLNIDLFVLPARPTLTFIDIYPWVYIGASDIAD